MPIVLVIRCHPCIVKVVRWARWYHLNNLKVNTCGNLVGCDCSPVLLGECNRGKISLEKLAGIRFNRQLIFLNKFLISRI